MRATIGVLIAVLLAGLGTLGYAGWIYLHEADVAVTAADSTVGGNAPPTAGAMEQIVIAGPMTSETVAKVRTAVRRAPHPPARFLVRSNDGSAAAAHELAGIINQLGADLVLANEALCSQACVMLLAEVPAAHRRISPGAWLRVSGTSPGLGPWIGRLSPNWLAFLEACPSRPLAGSAGIAMAWSEISRLDADPAAFDCTSLTQRTAQWLRGVTDANLFVHVGS